MVPDPFSLNASLLSASDPRQNAALEASCRIRLIAPFAAAGWAEPARGRQGVHARLPTRGLVHPVPRIPGRSGPSVEIGAAAMAKSDEGIKVLSVNKKARFNYSIEDTYRVRNFSGRDRGQVNKGRTLFLRRFLCFRRKQRAVVARLARDALHLWQSGQSRPTPPPQAARSS